ncbi:MAG: 3-deoxy-7-phosphoheptulonate synthase [Proteobacteria bacterium]|nr:3-deoxy-7-phosphoheptulonate synthase [Pseudomonadota bacterium]
MIIVMKPDATESEIQNIIKIIEENGLKPHLSRGKERVIIGAIGDESVIRNIPFDSYPGVENAVPILKPYKIVSREFKKENTIIKVDGEEIGGNKIAIIAGPCAVESREITIETALRVKEAGANFFRGGAYKPRTSPYSFQGLGEEGLKILYEAKKETGMPIVTELMDPRDADLVCQYADIIQIGARNMQNFRLLLEVGKIDKPVILKRGLSSTINELLMSAEYIASQGNTKIILCERGIRTFETATRNTLDLSAVPLLKSLTHLPVIVDPSHGTGHWDLVTPMAVAAVACGADGLMVEVHPHPEKALSDGSQSLKPAKFILMMEKIKAVATAVGRVI